MHNDLAWAVLGVDPATRKGVEHSAAQQGVSLGRFLELMLVASRNAAAEKAADNQACRRRDERLRDVMAEMAESLMAAADTLRSNNSNVEKILERRVEQIGPHETKVKRKVSERETDPPANLEQLQSWLCDLNEKASVPAEREKLSRFNLLRRSA